MNAYMLPSVGSINVTSCQKRQLRLCILLAAI